LFLVGGALIPPALIWAASARVRIYSEQTVRYLAFAQPFWLLLAARGGTVVRSARLRVVLPAALVAAFCAGLYPLAFLWPRAGLGDCRSAAAAVRRLARPGDCIAAAQDVGLPVAYYVRDDLLRQMTFGSFSEPPAELPAAPRVVLVVLHKRSMAQHVRSGGRAPAESPPPPAGYERLAEETIPGRKPITVSLFGRLTGAGEPPPSAAPAGPG
jgi:hypothetical protein